MDKENIKDLDLEQILEIGKRNSKRVKILISLFMLAGVGLAYVFRNIEGDDLYLILIGLLSQVTGFCATVLLSGQFLSIPERYNGIHNYAVTTAMAAPICVYMGSLIYGFLSIFFKYETSNVWREVSMVACMGWGIVIFAAGSFTDGLNMNIKDKQSVVYTGWYMVIFCLALQIYISLSSLEFGL